MFYWLTYIDGRQRVAPKLLNIHLESHWVMFGKHQNGKVRDKVWKQNWVSMQQHSRCKSYGMLSMCQFTLWLFLLLIELITCDLLCLFTAAVVRYYETKVVPAVAPWKQEEGSPDREGQHVMLRGIVEVLCLCSMTFEINYPKNHGSRILHQLLLHLFSKLLRSFVTL